MTPRVFLVGGTSHVGKSTVAALLARMIDGEVHSTDRIARHPGRPWRGTADTAVPDHVRDYYSRPDPQVLLTEVLAHYEANVVPHVVKLVEQRVRGEGRSVVIEGSALWPGFVSGLMGLPSVRGAWLTLSGDAIEERVFAESRYTRMPEAEKRLIESFLARTRAYATRMEMEARRLGLPIVSADGLTPEALARTLMAGAE